MTDIGAAGRDDELGAGTHRIAVQHVLRRSHCTLRLGAIVLVQFDRRSMCLRGQLAVNLCQARNDQVVTLAGAFWVETTGAVYGSQARCLCYKFAQLASALVACSMSHCHSETRNVVDRSGNYHDR